MATFLLTVAATAQSTWLVAPTIDAAWTGADGRLRAQVGRRVYLFDENAGNPFVVSVSEIPPDGDVFDHGDGFATTTLFDGAPTAAPLRAPLWLADGRKLVRKGDAIVPDVGSEGAASRPSFQRARERKDGYGLSGATVERESWPHVFALRREAPSALIAGRAGRYVLFEADGTETPAPPVDCDEEAAVFGFSATTPPFVADFDGDGTFEFVRVDAERGIVVVQSGLDRRPPPPPSPVLFGGPCPAAEAFDVGADGYDDLVAAASPSLTPARRLALLLEGALRCTWHVFDGGAEGLSELPSASIDVDLEVAITVRDGERRARVVPFVAATRSGLITAKPGGRPTRVPYGGGDRESFGEPLPEGAWLNPLRPVRAGARVFGVLRTAGRDRLVAF